MNGQKLHRRDAKLLQMPCDRWFRQTKIATPKIGWHFGMTESEALDVRLIDDCIRKRRFRRLVILPVKRGIDDD